MSHESIYEDLKRMPKETDSSYMQELGLFATRCDIQNGEKDLLMAVDDLSLDEESRYTAFYALFMLYRGRKQFSSCGFLIDKNKEKFEHHITFFDPLATYLVESGAKFDIDEFLTESYKKREEFDTDKLRQPGYIHAFAFYYACLYERCDEDGQEVLFKKWGEKAFEAINRAIELNPKHASYYSTKGRILASFHQYDEARALLNYAMQYYDPKAPNYPITISSIQYYDLLILNEQVAYNSTPHFVGGRLVKINGEGEKLPSAEAYVGDKPYAFISYSHKDNKAVYGLVHFLNRLGYRVWFDKQLTKGKNYAEEIHEKIVKSAQFICLISVYSQKSYFCINELSVALDNGINILPVLIDESPITPGFDLQIHQCQFLIKGPKQSYKSLYESVASNLIPSISK